MKKFFPWRLYWKFFGYILGTSTAVSVLGLGMASYINEFSFITVPHFLLILGLISMGSLGASLIAFRFVMPLRSVILSALRLANKKQFTENDEEVEDILEEEPGEYFELEVALQKIRRKLKKRRTQLAHEREESQALFSNLDDAVLSIDLQEKVKFYNSKFMNQFVSYEIRQSMGRENAAALPPSLREIFRNPELIKIFSECLIHGQVQFGEVKLFSQIDGDQRVYSLRVSPLKEEKTLEIYGALALFHDITEFKKIERIRNEFVENASHELRTPLTSIKGYLATVVEDIEANRLDQVGKFLGIISKNVDRLNLLVNDMLTIATLENGSQIKKDQILLAQLTEETIEKLQKLAQEKNIKIKYKCEAQQVFGDGYKIEQVLTNLIENAIKYIQQGGEIEVLWLDCHKEIILQVNDNGPGIAEDHQARLFERFYRIDKGRSRDVGGTGLGLSIVKHIVQNHGGSVSLESRIGAGASFTCRFPHSES